MLSNWWDRFFARRNKFEASREGRGRHTTRLRIEPLEERTLLSAAALFDPRAGALVLRGDSGANTAHVAVTNGFLEVDIDGHRYSSYSQSANYAVRLAGAGRDTLTQIKFLGGAGIDTLVLGSQDLAGRLTIRGDEVVQIDGQVTATATIAVTAKNAVSIEAGGALRSQHGADGGTIRLAARIIEVGGTLTADGVHGGHILLNAKNVLDYGTMTAAGTSGGGSVVVHFRTHYLETTAAHTSADGGSGAGGLISITAARAGGVSPLSSQGTQGAHAPRSGSSIYASGTASATGQTGGHIDFFAGTVRLAGAQADASGQSDGGNIRVGGDYQGKNPNVLNARTTWVGPGTVLDADALQDGPGGRVIVWADDTTEYSGVIAARGGPNGGAGGFIEVSGKGDLTFAGTADAGADNGPAGTLLLDPKNLVISSASGVAPQFNLNNPTPGVGDAFGSSVTPLSSGNIVVTDPGDEFGAANAGAVYLFNGLTGALISTLIGSTANDNVGNGGLTTLSNGNFVVSSVNWDNGAAVDAGAVTWGSGLSGISGVVSSANSLVGSTANDQVGTINDLFVNAVTALSNGNFVVRCPFWDNGAVVDAGAVTWGNGNGGTVGAVSPANSLVGSNANDQVGVGGYGNMTALSNGNYVVVSRFWNNGAVVDAGAVTWGNGNGGTVGAVSAANSLVGSTANDQVGNGGVRTLSNGNFVVTSPSWDNGAAIDAGAVTWGNGNGGTVGAVSAANSLVGSTTNDHVAGLIPLSNGNFVVVSSQWDNGGAVDAGAVTWANGNGGTVGAVSAANSLVGSTAYDYVGDFNIFVLSNGNFVFTSAAWDNGALEDAGAVTWGNGNGGTVGAVSAANSLVGAMAYDYVGIAYVTALSNGNYVVSSPSWHDGGAGSAGAVTWASGNGGTVGAVSAANSLVGSTDNDNVGAAVTALSNGNYVVDSLYWNNGPAVQAGAVTWGNGNGGTVGAVSAANSLVGSTTDDQVGYFGIVPLSNGNYVVTIPFWDNGAAVDAGAVTWGNGSGGTVGAVSAANSLVGSTTDDQVGGGFVTRLSNGNYVVRSTLWDKGAVVNAGAVTWANGNGGTVGAVSAANSLVGSTANDQVGAMNDVYAYGVTALSNGNFVVSSELWDNGALVDAGAVTWVNGASGKTLDGTGTVNPQNSLVGHAASSGQVLILNPANGTFLERFLNEGGGRVTVGLVDPNQLTYGRSQSQTLAVTPAFLKQTLDTGTAVILHASNDITINSPIVVNNPGGAGGALTLQAGRSIYLNADITTDDGNLTLIANDLLANGVVDSERDPGVAVISMAPGTSLSTGAGTLTIALRSGAGKTNPAAGDVTLQAVSAANLSVTNANGAIAGAGVITVPGTTTLSATGAVAFEAFGNNFVGAVDASGSSITLVDNSGLILGNVFVSGGGGLSVTAAGALTESGFVQANGPSSFVASSITLTGGTFNGPVSLASAGNASLTTGNSANLGSVTVGGNLSLTAAGGIFDTGNVAVTGSTTLNAGASVILNSGGNNFVGAVIVTAATSVNLVGETINLGTSTVSGTLTVKAGSAITDSGNLAVTGNTTLNAGGNIILDSAGNNFSGTVAVNTSGNATLVDSTALTLAASSIAGNLVARGAGVSQTGVLTVGGSSAFSGGVAAITLNPAGNYFIGTVSLITTLGNSASITDVDALTFGNVSVAGNLSVTAGGPIAGSNPISVGGTATFAAGTSSITLDSSGNDFSSLAVTSASNLIVKDANVLFFVVNLSGNLAVSAGGLVIQSGALTVAGTVSVTAADILLSSGGNNLSGTVSLTTPGNASLLTDGALDLGASQVGGSLAATSAFSSITGSGNVHVTGRTRLSAGGDIGFFGTGNDFGTVSISAAGNVTLYDANSIDLGTSSVGDLNVTAAGAITDSGNLTAFNATLIAGGDVVLDKSGNKFFGSVAVFTSGNAVLVDSTEMSLGASNVTGNLVVSGAGISETAAVTVGGTSTLNGGAGAITLTSGGNDFGGAVTVTTTGTASITDANALVLADLTAQNTVNLTAATDMTFTGSLATGNKTVTLITGGSSANLGNSTSVGAGGQLVAANGVTVGNGDQLSGSGAIDVGSGAAGLTGLNGATLAPVLTLTVDGDLVLNSGATLSLELNGTGAGLFDQLDVTDGGVTLGGATLALNLGYSPSLNDSFQIIQNDLSDSVSGTFATGGTLTVGAVTFGINYAGGSDNDVALTATSIPGGSGNVAPTLSGVPISASIDELVLYSFDANASDPDLPAPTLTFSLVGGPAGASIDSSSGVFIWTPTEAQGPDSYQFVVRVSDGTANTDATITLFVREMNMKPGLSNVPGSATVVKGNTFTIDANAGDTDEVYGLPNTLTFSLVGAPAGASIDPDTGVFTWTPSEDLAPGDYTFSVRVADDGVPSRSDTQSITVTVTAAAIVSGDLVVSGTSANDIITVNLAAGDPSKVNVVINGESQGLFDLSAITGKISVRGFAGNDKITIAAVISKNAELIGGLGNDTLTGGGGNDSLTGGAGNDSLAGGKGNDVYLFGNSWGVDKLVEAASSGTDTLDFSAATLGITFTKGGSVKAKLGLNSVTASVESIVGGSGFDTLVSTNTLTANTWNVTASNAGTLNATFSFSGIENLTGSAGADKFNLADGAGVSGTINGGLGGNTLSYAAYTTAVRVNLTLGSATNIDGISGIGNVTGGAGDDVLVGNASNNTLTGNAGRDILIGGLGADKLNGGAGDDILIGGTTDHDTLPAELDALMAEWSRTDLDYLSRLNHLLGPTGGLNGAIFLNPTFVHNDNGKADSLTGGSELDWFLTSLGDAIKDKNSGGTETQTAC